MKNPLQHVLTKCKYLLYLESKLEPEERAAVEELQTRAQAAWLRAKDIGMVEGEGLPAYTPRMVMNVATAGEKNSALSLNGFVGEFLIFRGVCPLSWISATVSVLGLLVTAVVILTVIQKVFSGPVQERWAAFPDLHHGERMALAPVIGLMFLLGLVPQLIVNTINPTVQNLLAHWRF